MGPTGPYTLGFAAPEVLASIIPEEVKDSYGYSPLLADIFSLGITFLEVLGAHPVERLWKERPGVKASAEMVALKAYRHGKVHAFPVSASLPPDSTRPSAHALGEEGGWTSQACEAWTGQA